MGLMLGGGLFVWDAETTFGLGGGRDIPFSQDSD